MCPSGILCALSSCPHCAEYNELKTELSDFLRDFAQQGKVWQVMYGDDDCQIYVMCVYPSRLSGNTLGCMHMHSQYTCIFCDPVCAGGVKERH